MSSHVRQRKASKSMTISAAAVSSVVALEGVAMFTLPILGELLSPENLCDGHPLFELSQHVLAPFVYVPPSCRRQADPHVRKLVILLHPLPASVVKTKVELGLGIALFGQRGEALDDVSGAAKTPKSLLKPTRQCQAIHGNLRAQGRPARAIAPPQT